VLVRALELHDEHEVLTQASAAIEATAAHLKEHWPSITTAVLTASGKGTVKALRKQLPTVAMRAAAVDVDFTFDATNPRAVEWVKAHALRLIDDLSETTRNDIRDLMEDAFEGEFDTGDLADQLEELLGDATRAETIARTETMRASNQGQLEAWEQAKQAGLLVGNEQVEWITTPDDRLCPICEPLDGQTTALGSTFEVDGDRISTPPAHPRCRCTTGLSFS
jgi:SPP1 gp7 family putative phage head morphogenesis protein